MDEDTVPVEMQDFELSDAVLDTAEPFIPLAASRGKTLTLQIEPGIRFHGNETMIRQLVSLLLDNAVKYSDEGGKDLTFPVCPYKGMPAYCHKLGQCHKARQAR